jgi:hypothetical protein
MKELHPELSEVLNIVIKYVNYIKMRPLKNRLFAQICEEMGEQYVIPCSVAILIGCKKEMFWLVFTVALFLE